VLGCSVLWFEREEGEPGEPGALTPVGDWREAATASVTTHDLPTALGWLRGEHVRVRAELGLLEDPAAEERAWRRERAELLAHLVAAGVLSSADAPEDELGRALHTYLCRTPSRYVLAALGDAVGRTDLLRRRPTADGRAASLDLERLLAPAGAGPRAHDGSGPPTGRGWELGRQLAAIARPAVSEPALVEPRYRITTADRAVGAGLGGEIAKEHGTAAPLGRVRARFEGSAGQSFGAFLAAGVELDLTGEANDGVGKAMAGGRIAIRPPDRDGGSQILVGNAALYGATGGELFCAGGCGDRFAVRNSGAVAVVEGVGDHACEYMTGGTVVVLATHGLNLGAGMSAGHVYVERLDRRRLSAEAAALTPDRAALEELRALLERHLRFTGSARAAALLAAWPEKAARFSMLVSGEAAVDAGQPVPARPRRRAVG
jgi:glutamate synthase domain-containing protein 3